MLGRPYDEERDLASVTRMWREVGWIDGSDQQGEALRTFLQVGGTLVADVHGEAECAVHRTRGSFRHLDTDLPLSAITAVTTSHVGRHRGLASALMTETLAAAHDEGAAVAMLGMFEQGFYDRFGFGTGTYEHELSFDPTSLTVPVPDRPPVRLSQDDFAEIHALLVRRHRGHGTVVLDPPEIIAAELAWIEKPFGLGFREGEGRLTHFVFGEAEDEHGPYIVRWIGYEEPSQLLELLGLLRGLGDQVGRVVLAAEPPEIQVQDVLRQPLRQWELTRLAGGHRSHHEAVAEMQLRILDLGACVGAVRLETPPLSFGIRLHDPLADRPGAPWQGIGGEYTMHLAGASSVEGGLAGDLPVLEASVNAFSRLWAGARPASSLALTDRLSAPAELLRRLDQAFRLPPPLDTWSF